MRVITGSARGRKLIPPVGSEIRPTSEMTKEAVFSMIQFEVPQARVLDLFAGTGQMGIEALSRGAKQAIFVDANRVSLDLARQNVANTSFEAQSKLMGMDFLSFLRGTSEVFDIAFLDPPYDQNMIEDALPLLVGHMSERGVILCETSRTEELPESAGGGFDLKKVYRYGKAKITTYRRPVQED